MKKQKLFGGLYYTFFANGFTALVISAVMPYIIEHYGINYEVAGTLLALVAVGNLVSTYLAGWFADKIGIKTSITILSSFVSIGLLGIWLTNSIPMLYVFFIMVGITRGSISNINNYIINHESSGKPKYLNYLHTFYAIGAFLSPLFISLIIQITNSWQLAIAGSVVVALTLIIVYAVMPIENSKPISEQRKTGSSTKSISFYLACLLLFFYVGAENAINGWLVTYLTAENLVNETVAQILLSSIWLVMIVGRLLCASISEKISKTSIVLICALGATFFFSTFIIFRNPVIISTSLFLIGFFLSPLYPTIISVCSEQLSHSAKLMGSFLAIGGLGKIFIPYVVGYVANQFTVTWGMATIGISLILTCLLSFAMLRKNKMVESV